MNDAEALAAALDKLLEPLVQLLVRNGLPHGALADIAKQVYVRVAAEEERIAGRKQTVSRMSLLTGLTRKEISRILKLPPAPAQETSARYHRASRVITGWIRDPRFLAADGQPRPLEMDGDGDTFAALVKAYSGDVPARAVLDELERVEAVRTAEEGHILLVARGYLPRAGEAEKLQILGTDVAGLIATIRHNLDPGAKGPFFQRKVFYDNLVGEALPQLRAMSAEQGQRLLETLDRWMAAHDREVHPELEGPSGRRAGIGIYYFEEPVDGEDDPS